MYLGANFLSIGTTTAAKHCQMLKEIELLQEMDMDKAVIQRMCQRKSLRKSLKAEGIDCD
jgi:hypothetical protein